MPGLKAWDGSSFVDGEPRIWNGSAFVAPSACHVWDGTQFVKVWPTFTRQRMVKVGNYAATTSATPSLVDGWTSDSTYPATISSDRMQIQGSGSVTLFAQINSDAFNGNGMTMSFYLNGAEVYSQQMPGSDQIVTMSFETTVSDGDLFDLRGRSSVANTRVLEASTYLEVHA